MLINEAPRVFNLLKIIIIIIIIIIIMFVVYLTRFLQ
jgi:hypothetical protein